MSITSANQPRLPRPETKVANLGQSRRALLRLAGGVAGASLIGVGGHALAAVLVKFDFRGQIPTGITFRRAGPAAFVDGSGRVKTVAANVPRFPYLSGLPRGILIEGEATNLLESSTDLKHASWSTTGGMTVTKIATQTAPDGSSGVFRITRGTSVQDSQVLATIRGATGEEFGTASIWLRSPTTTGNWRMRLRDFVSYDTATSVVQVGPGWRRYSLGQLWQYRATGTKKFMVIDASPPVETLLPSIDVWGPQYEKANEPSSPIATAGQPVRRVADEVTFPGSRLQVNAGRLTIELPDGGRRSGLVIDADGDGPAGLRIEYSNSGWIVAKVGGIQLNGLTEVTQDRVVELRWSSAGAQISTGATATTLVARAAVKTSPQPLACGPTARLGMTVDGRRPLGRVFASIALDDQAGTITTVATPVFVPQRYALVFADEFDDTDVSRINENGTGGRPGAPAWRSRYNQDRATVINQEKQIYMDVKFAGTAPAPLGVQPFSIANSVLKIRADRADPVGVSPYIWNYRYVSGCITSQATYRQKYGYFEMRAKLPIGKGFWPAFWLLPSSTKWPPEIDVLEASGARRMSVHSGRIEAASQQTSTVSGNWVDNLIDTGDGFHWYGTEWTDKLVTFFVDGRKTLEFQNNSIHEEMYLLANLALGSSDQRWIPDPDDTTPFPGFLEIDHIRAYALG